jgi:hypothetical protein
MKMINKKPLEQLTKAFKAYDQAVRDMDNVSKKKREKVSEKLLSMESYESVAIEHP